MSDESEAPQWRPEMIERWKRENRTPYARRLPPYFRERGEEGMSEYQWEGRQRGPNDGDYTADPIIGDYTTNPPISVQTYRPAANAVVIHLHEFQSEAGIERRLSYSIEVKDQHLEGDLRRLAAELMNQRGFKP